MKFYRYLFGNMGELSPNEKLVYSALLFHSINTVSEHYGADGRIDLSVVKLFIQEHKDSTGLESLDYYPVSVNKLSTQLGMTRSTVRKILDSLRNKHHLLTDDTVVCPTCLLDGGYVDYHSSGLKGRQLIFYLYLKDRSFHTEGVIDTWAVTLGKATGITKRNAYDILSILEGKKLVERLPDGKLKVK